MARSDIPIYDTTRLPQIILIGLAFGALWFELCRTLASEWSLNEQYNFGWFVPFFAAYLFWLRWQDRPRAEAQRSELGAGSTEQGAGSTEQGAGSREHFVALA